MIVRILRPRRSGGGSFAIRLTRWCLLAGGLLAVGYSAYAYAARSAYQTYGNWAFDHAVHQAAIPKLPDLKTGEPTLIGKISIPRLAISAIVKEGVDDDTLGIAVGHFPSSPLPGRPGNVAVSAHRDTFFRNLKDVRRDDEITMSTESGRYVYRVASYRVVLPTDVSVLAPSPGENTLTLVTCYPFYFVGPAPKRFIVRAQLVSSIPRPAAE
jgi:sortase A